MKRGIRPGDRIEIDGLMATITNVGLIDNCTTRMFFQGYFDNGMMLYLEE